MSKFTIERRTLLKGAAVTGVAACTPMVAGAAIKPLVDGLQRAEFPMPDFKSVTGESVTVRNALGEAHHAEVLEVSEMPSACLTHARPSYLRSCATVVRFRVADASSFGNEVYQLAHPQLGKMDLLLSVVPDANGEFGLEAIFN